MATGSAYLRPFFVLHMLVEGIVLGLTLSLMIGPLLFAIVQAGLVGGFRAGAAIGAGIWVSDALFALLTYYGTSALASFTALPNFRLWAGLVGGLLLVSFGIGSLLKRPAQAPSLSAILPAPNLWLYAVRGFLINTVNPFTVFFWIGIGSGVIATRQAGGGDALRFFGGMLCTLAIADLLKAWGAKGLRQWLTPRHLRWVQQAIGVLLIVFGVVLVGRAI